MSILFTTVGALLIAAGVMVFFGAPAVTQEIAAVLLFGFGWVLWALASIIDSLKTTLQIAASAAAEKKDADRGQFVTIYRGHDIRSTPKGLAVMGRTFATLEDAKGAIDIRENEA